MRQPSPSVACSISDHHHNHDYDDNYDVDDDVDDEIWCSSCTHLRSISAPSFVEFPDPYIEVSRSRNIRVVNLSKNIFLTFLTAIFGVQCKYGCAINSM